MQIEKFSLIFFKNEERILEKTYNNLEKRDNILRFNMLDYDTLIDLNNHLFSRENDEFKFVLDILNKKCTILLKKENMTLDINVDLCELNVMNNEITLEYIIESDDSKNRIIITKEEC